MRNTKKWLVLLLTVVMLVNAFGVSAAATGNESPIGVFVSPAADDASTVHFNILTAEAQTVADGKLVVTYDPAVLTYVGTELGAAWTNADQVTLSVNPAEGKVILAFASAEAATEGVLFTLTFSGSGDSVIAVDGGSSYITGLAAIPDMGITTCPSAQFTDVATLFPEAHDAVDYMVAKGYMNGMSLTAFGPHVELNRAMMVTILYRIAGTPAVEGAPTFTDVPEGKFYTDAVAWATTNSITNGISEHLFAPEKTLTRQELVTFLYRFAQYNSKDMTATTDLSAYTDAADIQPYAVEPFQWAVANGIIKGTTETTLDPEATTTRAQVCLMVYRMLSSWE